MHDLAPLCEGGREGAQRKQAGIFSAVFTNGASLPGSGKRENALGVKPEDGGTCCGAAICCLRRHSPLRHAAARKAVTCV